MENEVRSLMAKAWLAREEWRDAIENKEHLSVEYAKEAIFKELVNELLDHVAPKKLETFE